jgi:hypothetical protein
MPVPPGLVVKTINVEDMRIITTLKNYLFYYVFDVYITVNVMN